MKKVLSLCMGILLLSLHLPFTASAQNSGPIPVRGTVVDASGFPVSGATVFEVGTSNGTVTDQEGAYSLRVSGRDAYVSINIMGYKEVTYPATSDQLNLVVLEEDTTQLDEVVVIGYGQVKKADANGAVQVFKPDPLNRVKATTTTDLLLGKVAGLQITQGSGSVGSSGTVRIRQGASLNASNTPLIVIDGMVDQSISSINPDDIESISVLKDASSAAIYGARGANGVIIITTKKGSDAKGGQFIKPAVSYKGEAFVNYKTDYLPVYSADEFREEYVKRGWDASKLGTASTDWQKEISRTAYTHKHTVSLRGALPYVPYRVSVGFQEENGAIISHKQDVGTVTANFTPKLLDDHLTFDLGVKDTYKDTPTSAGSFSGAAWLDPTIPVYGDYPSVTVNGVTYDHRGYGYYIYGSDPDGSNGDEHSYNSAAEVRYPGSGYIRANRFVTNATMVYKVHGLEDLSATVSFNGNYYRSRYKSQGVDNTPRTWATDYVSLGKGGQGKHSYGNSYARHYNMDYFVNYRHQFGIHGVDITAGHSYESTYSDYWDSPTYWNDGETEAGSVEGSGMSENNLASWFGRINYTLADKYLLTFTMRADASSRFAPETRWGYFPSAAFAWKVNKENFLKDVRWIDELKLRLSYGTTGQQEIGNDYAYQTSYFVSTDQYMYREGDDFYYVYRPAAFDRSIQWEVTKTANAGLDYGFFGGRLYGSFDYYDRKTTNLLMSSVKVPAGSNFAVTTDQNIGEMTSKGIEFSIGAVPVSTRDWYWSINANFAWNKSTITKLTSYDDPDAYIKTGYTDNNRYMQWHKVGDTPYTFHLAKQAYDEDGKPLEKFYNPNYDPSDPASEEFVLDDTNDKNMFDTGKSSLVPYYGGLSTQVRFRNWDFGLNAHYAFGQYVFWKAVYGTCNSSFYNESYSFPTNTYKDVVPYWETRHSHTDHWLHKGDYFKVDNIVVGYTLPKKASWYNSIRLSVGLQNVLTLTDYPGIDPEVYDGLDGSSTPRPHLLMFSVNIDL
ncbi:MAG: SusC/RagA family TonB-linked outer membrane protein [Bacteroidales bacterium]|nr:SusC/RagA family TonB-linked outer membrane protein [Bacteroidales bacterium]